MKRLVMCGFVLAAGLVALAPNAAEAGKEKGGGKGAKLESKAGTAPSALTVCFTKELGLGFPSLATLGVRIEQARDQADPVCLALAGRELAVAEKVSGKQASVKADDLLKEAVELAKLRSDPAELKAVALLAGKMGGDLTALAMRAEKTLAEAKKDRESGVKTRGIMGELHTDSRVNATISVYVDGRFMGTMGPFGDLYTFIGQTAGETTYLQARSRDGRVWNLNVRRAVNNEHWILYP